MPMSESNGWIKTVVLPPPSLKDNTSDAGRLTGVLKKILQTEGVKLDLDLLRQLPGLLRRWDYRARCVLFRDHKLWQVIGICDPGGVQPVAGLAVDLGTSRVVLRLVDLATHEILSETAFNNPQIAIGPDVLARIHHADEEGGLEYLHRLIVEGLNRAIASAALVIACVSAGPTRALAARVPPLVRRGTRTEGLVPMPASIAGHLAHQLRWEEWIRFPGCGRRARAYRSEDGLWSGALLEAPGGSRGGGGRPWGTRTCLPTTAMCPSHSGTAAMRNRARKGNRPCAARPREPQADVVVTSTRASASRSCSQLLSTRGMCRLAVRRRSPGTRSRTVRGG